MSEDLKPCPFCGGKAEILPDESFKDYWNVQCSNDKCGAMVADVSQRHAVLNWNRRVK